MDGINCFNGMNLKKIYLCFALTAAVVVACDKAETDLPLSGEDLVPEVKMIVETISGTNGSNTRATIANSDASFKWTVGDNIAVHVSNGDEHMYVFTSGTGGADAAAATAKFVVAYPAGYSRDAFAVYLSSGNSDDKEWWYMLRSRPTDNRSYTRAVINTDGTPVNGIILFPDYYDGGTPAGVTTWGNLMNSYSASTFDNGAKCTIAGWEALEAAGCVFLPAAGYRDGNTYTSNELRYASCSPRNDNLWYILSFKNGEMIYWNDDEI